MTSGTEHPETRGMGDSETRCAMCASTRRVVNAPDGEVHCAECGLVFDSAEYVAPPPMSSPEREGSGRGIGPFAQPGATRRSLGSTITVSRDGQGRRLDWHRRYEFQHLKRVMQRQTARTIEGPLDRSQARGEIALLGEKLGLPPVVVAEAERIFREAKLRGLFRGRSQPAAVGAAVYAACRRYCLPRTLAEVAKELGARRAEVGRAFKMVHRGVETPIPAIGTKAFLARYAEELALSAPVRSTVEEMLDEAGRSPEFSGLSPHGLVAALIYLASERHGERRTRAEVARVSAVTEVTLRSTSRLVERLFGRWRGRRASP